MIRMTNQQVALFNSEAFKELYNNTERRFPISDAFKLEEILSLIEEKIKIYRKISKDLFEKHNVVVNEQGFIDVSKTENREEFQKEFSELETIEIEIDADKLKIKDNWPDLSMIEMKILKPIIE